jgi:hypothetical protein
MYFPLVGPREARVLTCFPASISNFQKIGARFAINRSLMRTAKTP